LALRLVSAILANRCLMDQLECWTQNPDHQSTVWQALYIVFAPEESIHLLCGAPSTLKIRRTFTKRWICWYLHNLFRAYNNMKPLASAFGFSLWLQDQRPQNRRVHSIPSTCFCKVWMCDYVPWKRTFEALVSEPLLVDFSHKLVLLNNSISPGKLHCEKLEVARCLWRPPRHGRAQPLASSLILLI
jgi:hypothetical protein